MQVLIRAVGSLVVNLYAAQLQRGYLGTECGRGELIVPDFQYRQGLEFEQGAEIGDLVVGEAEDPKMSQGAQRIEISDLIVCQVEDLEA